MATNFAQALFQGMDDSNQRRLQEQSMQRQNRLADLAVSREERVGQTDQRGQLAQLARGWKSLTDSAQRRGYYDRFIQPAVSQMGFGDLGPYDEAAVDGVASQILAAYGPGKATNPYDGLPADIQTLRMLQDNPQLAALDKERRQYSGMVPKLVETSQGIGWGTPGAGIQLAPLQGTAGQISPPASSPQASELFAALGNKYGIQPTSVLRTPERNRQVGGVANSYHLSGQAADWVVPQPLKAQFIADAKATGFEAIDEGDHVHIEPAGRGGASQSAVAQPFQKPPAASDFERRIRLAMELGATESQIKDMVLGETGGGKPTATQMRQANVAKTKLIDLRAIRQQLNTVREKFEPLKGSFSAGGIYGVGGNLIPSEEGQRFDAAVDLMRQYVRKLTRTPGEGAMSDWEGRIANLANPSRGDRESVTIDKIDQLDELLTALEQGYSSILQDNGGNMENVPGAKQSETSIDSLLEKYK